MGLGVWLPPPEIGFEKLVTKTISLLLGRCVGPLLGTHVLACWEHSTGLTGAGDVCMQISWWRLTYAGLMRKCRD